MSSDDSILPRAQAPVPPAPPPPAEDAGSQALAEALRSSFFIVKIIMAGLFLVFLASGFFTVGPQEQAIVLRLGRPVGEGQQALRDPGLHLGFPRPIDVVVRIPITSIQTADSSVGWYQSTQDRLMGVVPNPGGNDLNPATSSYALSADTNIVHVRATLQIRITDPIAFHFDFVNAPVFITNALNNALIYAAGQMPIDDILTRDLAGFKERVRDRLQEIIRFEHLGITPGNLDVGVSPPLFLLNKFNEVNQAGVNRNTLLTQAQSYANKMIADAHGDAATRTNAADAARKRTVDLLAAQAATFQKLRSQYEQNPPFFERIRQMTLLNDIYNDVQDKITMPPNTKELRLQLSREPQAPSTNSYIQGP